MANSWNGPQLGSPIRTDVPELQKKLIALLKGDPTSVADIPSGAKRLVNTSGVQWQVQQYNGSSWAAIGKLMHDVDKLDGYHAAITPAANTVAVRNADKKLEGDITGNATTASSAATLSETLPVNKGGTGATTSEAARSNLGVPPTSHTSTNTTYGVGNATQYGHLKLSDATDSASGVSGGVAATPAAAKAAKDAADAAQSSADAAMTKASTLATSSTPGIVKPGTGLQIGEEGAMNVVAEQTGCLPLTGGTMTGGIHAQGVSVGRLYVRAEDTGTEGGQIELFPSIDNTESHRTIIGNYNSHHTRIFSYYGTYGVGSILDLDHKEGILKWNDSEVFLPVGALLPSFASSMNGCLLCNGAEASRTTYANLFAILGTAFGKGNGSTTFNLPDFRDKTLWGANNNLMKIISAGAPNINGSIGNLVSTSIEGGANRQGAFEWNNRNGVGIINVGPGMGWRFDPTFNASWSSPVYGNSKTIQPPAIAVNIFIKY